MSNQHTIDIEEISNLNHSGKKIYALLMDYFGTVENIANASIVEIEACFSSESTTKLIKEIHSAQIKSSA